MFDDYPPENEPEKEEQDPCEGCTTDCSLCTYQTELDKILGIYTLRQSEDNFVHDEQLIPAPPPVTAPLPTSSNNDQQMLILQPFPVDPLASTQMNPYAAVESTLELPLPKRRRGAPAGNTNAVKHGLYIEGKRLRNTSPIERMQLLDFNSIITHFKNYFESTYEKGLQAPTLYERIDTLRALSMALLALNRTVASFGENCSTGLPSELADRKKLSSEAVVEYFNKKVTSFMQASDPGANGPLQE